MSERVYVYAWGNNSRRAELKGRRCVIEVVGGTMRTVLVRFLDTGERVTTSRRALRDAPAQGRARGGGGVRVAIFGSRGYPDRRRVAGFVHALAVKHPGAVVVSGGARDVDTWAEETALIEGLGVVSYRPYEFEAMEGGKLFSIETVTHGDAAQELVVAKHRRINPPCFRSFVQAAFTRNGWIVDDAEQVVAFWNGSSSGTADTLERARLAGVPRHVYEVAA